MWEKLSSVFHLLTRRRLCWWQGSRAVLDLRCFTSARWRHGGGRLCCKAFLLPLRSVHTLQPREASTPQFHKNTESPSSFLSLFFYWKLHQRKQKFKPNIHWSTESPRSGKMAAIRIVVQMENIKKKIKKNHSSTDLSKTFWDISTQMPI